VSEPYRKKLIEVALPLEAINEEASLRKRKAPTGYPTTLHKWWAQRPLAACRAVLFASIVDDPSSRPNEFPTEESQAVERQRLFRILEELVKWENSANEKVLEAARQELRKATGGNPPPVLDPFCGGGSIPLEAQRLGLEAYASDLNPVAVLITKALIEIPARFAGQPPANPASRETLAHGATWAGPMGLAEDVRYYGKWMRDCAFKRVGHLYPKAALPDGTSANVIAWLWARTAICPNPACGAVMPLVSSFVLSTRKGKEWHVEPVVSEQAVRFAVRSGRDAPSSPKVGRGSSFRCLVCGHVANDDHIKAEGVAGRIGTQLMAMVVEGERARTFLSPSDEHVAAAELARPEWIPEEELPYEPRAIWCTLYGLTRYADLFTPRQLAVLSTLSGLVDDVRERAREDGCDEGYADAIATYLALAVDRAADYGNSLATWRPKDNAMRSLFAQQAIPMVWDFAEGNVFAKSSSGFGECVEVVARCLERVPGRGNATAKQLDATAAVTGVAEPLVCTDPPYYDNVGYADLSDFFYVWLRRSLGRVYPDLFSTLLTPKNRELISSPYRFDGDRQRADQFFEDGFRQAFKRTRQTQHPRFPLTLFYAFKQAESSADGGVASTGWDTMLTGLLDGQYTVTGTWPMRTEGDNRNIGIGANALASSIVLVCRPRADDAPMATRRELVGALRAELPTALRQLQHGNIAPVDLAQAAIGPGMAVFSRYAKVLEADGTPMKVRAALSLINQTLDEILAEQEGDFDGDTRFAVTWFEQHGFGEGPFGQADVLAKAKDTSPVGLEQAGILVARAGKVRLLRRGELADDWDPVSDRRPTVWEATQHLARRLESDGGEPAAADLLRRLGGLGETARELAYRLYTTCERKGWAQDALAYNALVVAWPEIARLVAGTPEAEAQQALEV
jgi:putative DNA methylase